MRNASYRRDWEDVLEELCAVMADMEDVRDEIAEIGEENADAAEDVKRLDAAIKCLDQAASILEDDE